MGKEEPPAGLIVVREQSETEDQAVVEQPAKLLRIASMIRQLLEEVRQASLDEHGRRRLQAIYERSLEQLRDVLSEELQDELASLAVPFEGVPSESEIRVAQAQLVGWLEGLFHGIQAALWAQQMQARAQFEEMRRRALTAGGAGRGGPQGEPPAPQGEWSDRRYL